jgi:DNA-binding MarR family transcriptional regulator
MTETESRKSRDGDSIREQYPSGWLALTKNGSVVRIVDALLDLPPRREFNQTELAEQADVSRQSVSRHLELLLAAGVIETVENTRPQRYRFDPESDVSQAIIRLDGAMNGVGPEA